MHPAPHPGGCCGAPPLSLLALIRTDLLLGSLFWRGCGRQVLGVLKAAAKGGVRRKGEGTVRILWILESGPGRGQGGVNEKIWHYKWLILGVFGGEEKEKQRVLGTGKRGVEGRRET